LTAGTAITREMMPAAVATHATDAAIQTPTLESFGTPIADDDDRVDGGEGDDRERGLHDGAGDAAAHVEDVGDR
jgi:hypothetical protein